MDLGFLRVNQIPEVASWPHKDILMIFVSFTVLEDCMHASSELWKSSLAHTWADRLHQQQVDGYLTSNSSLHASSSLMLHKSGTIIAQAVYDRTDCQ